MRDLPPLTWFRSFDAAARHLNFTAAAQELGLTQSAISQQVRALETRLGAELFRRLPRGLALTDEGRMLLPHVDQAIDSLRSGTSRFDFGPEETLITVATSVSIARWLIQPNLHAFLSMHPGLRIRLVSTIWPDEFVGYSADVEVRFGTRAQVGRRAERLLPDTLIAVRSANISRSEPIVVESVGTAATWETWADVAGLTSPAPAVFVDSFGEALDLVVNGAGQALVPLLLANPLLDRGTVVRVDATEVQGPEGYYLATPTNGKAAEAFATWIKDLVGASGHTRNLS